jgi:Fe-S-cluster containining protein
VAFCREPEIDIIISALKKNEVPAAERILRQAELQAVKWMDHCQKFQALSTDAFLMAWREKGEPCAFLDLETDFCLVYPIRPMVCRSWISLKNSKEECRPADFIFARVAQRVVEMRAMERGLRKSEAIPITNWLAFKAKEFLK